ncbi:MAG TPA: class I SAM-dependent methyltransferase [Pyrinomonadaceae bacterium]|nr:class I SAM-dependent methyltransferase [Pyrinomonadaceae bacterium]
MHVAPRVSRLHCVDASSDALLVAKRNLMDHKNVEFHEASVDAMPFCDESMDFGYSLGVLHHVPDTAAGIASCARKLKPGAPLLVYLYYAFDNRPRWFRTIWRFSDRVRNAVSIMPFSIKKIITDLIAAMVYFPLARAARLIEYLGGNVNGLPLSTYRKHSFYTMRTDALDRFGTRLEQRFTRNEIHEMMENAGLESVRFGDGVPYWCALGVKRLRGR